MIITETEIKGCFIIDPNTHVDERGGFMRVFCEDTFSVIRKNIYFKQINHSYNSKKGTFRGIHYQDVPYAEEKLVRCVSGSLIDIFVDIRKNSPTFLKHVQVEISAHNKKMIFLAKGIAHGFQTLEDNTELIYHHTENYKPEAAKGIKYADVRLGIQLSLPISVISDKDANYEELTNNFNGIEI